MSHPPAELFSNPQTHDLVVMMEHLEWEEALFKRLSDKYAEDSLIDLTDISGLIVENMILVLDGIFNLIEESNIPGVSKLLVTRLALLGLDDVNFEEAGIYFTTKWYSQRYTDDDGRIYMFPTVTPQKEDLND